MDTLEHFVLPLIKSYIADGDFPPFNVASQTLIFFSLQISSILVMMASLIFIISPFVEFLYGIPRNYYTNREKYSLVELHDIDSIVYFLV